jgi:hypothetical protein
MPDGVTADRSTAEFPGRYYEKFGWPHADLPNQRS